MSVFEFFVGWLFMTPGGAFTFLVLLSIYFFLKRKPLHKSVSQFFLRAAGWKTEGQKQYSCFFVRWGAGIAFLLFYSTVLFSQFSIVVNFPTFFESAKLVLYLIASCICFAGYVASFYSCVAATKNKVWLIPALMGQGIEIEKILAQEVAIKDLLVASLVYTPSWGRWRLVLVQKRKILQVINF